MKKVAIIAAITLAACSAQEDVELPKGEDDAPAAAAPVAEAPAEETALTAADGQPPEGSYEITQADGTVFTETVNADGTFLVTDADGASVAGTWRVEGPNRWCSKLEDEDEENCFNETVGDDGVWRSVDEDDPAAVSIVVRVE